MVDAYNDWRDERPMTAASAVAFAGGSLAMNRVWSSALISGCRQAGSWWMASPVHDPAHGPVAAPVASSSITSAAGWKTSSIGCWKTKRVGVNPGSSPSLGSNPRLNRARRAENLCRRSLGVSLPVR